jgi:hypothetical protein
MTNLGLVLADRYERRRDARDLDAAIEAFHSARDATPPGSPYLPHVLVNLGGGLLDRFERGGEADDLDEAVSLFERALAMLPTESLDAAAVHNRLAAALQRRFERFAQLADIDRAVAAARRAVALTPGESPRMPGWLDGLGRALRSRFAATAASDDRRDAAAAFHTAAANGLESDVATALRSALAWEEWETAAGGRDDAAVAARLAVAAREGLVATQVVRADKETWLRDAEGLGGRAGRALAEAGDARGAVVAVETCRAALLAEALELGHRRLARLAAAGRPDLVARLRAVADAATAPRSTEA